MDKESLQKSKNNEYAILDATYLAMGKTLSMWSSIEFHLSILFSVCLTPDNIRLSSAAFWKIESFQSRLNMTNQVLKELLKDRSELAKEWKNLINKISNANTSRNKIAHGTVIIYSDDSLSINDEVFLSPFHYDKSLFNSYSAQEIKNTPDFRPKLRLYIKDIDKIGDEFRKLRTEMRTFISNLNVKSM